MEFAPDKIMQSSLITILKGDQEKSTWIDKH
jgi:hypothetical protein